MASTIRLGLLQYGNVQKTFSYHLLCRSLSTKVSNHTDSPVSRNQNATVDKTGAAGSTTKPNFCFPSEKVKEMAQEKFKSSQKGVLTFPNLLTLSRMATAPAIGYFIWNGMNYPALACFAFAATTDLLDGFIARRFNQDSDIGAILDPLADKILLSTCIISMYNVDMVPLWLVKGIVFRDLVLISMGTVIRCVGFHEKLTWKKFFDIKNYPTLGFNPTRTSKCATALLCALIPLQLSTTHLVGIPTYDWSIFGLQLITLITSTASMAQYASRLNRNTFSTKPNRSRG